MRAAAVLISTTLCISGLVASAHAQELIVEGKDADGNVAEIRWNLVSPYTFDNEDCNQTLFVTGSTIEGSNSAGSAPCPTWLELDGTHYPLKGTLERFLGGLYVTSAPPEVGACRRKNGDPLESTNGAVIIINADSVPIAAGDPQATLSPVPDGNVWHFDSSTGDVICDGSVPPPDTSVPASCDDEGAIFVGGFENCP